MTPVDFKRWRKWMGLSQKQAAASLGLKRRVVQYYENGMRNGEPFLIPLAVELACYALANGVTSYRGPYDVRDDMPTGPQELSWISAKLQNEVPSVLPAE